MRGPRSISGWLPGFGRISLILLFGLSPVALAQVEPPARHVYAERAPFQVTDRGTSPIPSVLGEGLDRDPHAFPVHAVSGRPGQRIADLGPEPERRMALLAHAVGEAGKLFVTAHASEAREALERRVEVSGLSQVHILSTGKDEVPVEEGSLDVALQGAARLGQHHTRISAVDLEQRDAEATLPLGLR